MKFYGIDGHNYNEIIEALEKAKTIKGKPTAIIAKTIKGKGVSFMETKLNGTEKHQRKKNILRQ